MTRIPKIWPGSTVVCLGGGPSLTLEDVNAVRGKARVIAINDAYKLAPWADCLYACDGTWWRVHGGVTVFTGMKYGMTVHPRDAERWGVKNLKKLGDEGLSLDPTGLRTGRNSGYQAINLAVLFGATRILLLGYDMNRHDGASHWFGDHPSPLRRQSPYPLFRRQFETIVEPLKDAGVDVVNCSRWTELDCFQKQTLEDALPISMAVSA